MWAAALGPSARSIPGGLDPRRGSTPRPSGWVDRDGPGAPRRRHHSLEQLHDGELAASTDRSSPSATASSSIRARITRGAWSSPTPRCAICSAPNRVPPVRFEARSIVTHKTPHASFPGGRRPEVVLVMERLLELLVRRLGLVPVAVRRRNLVRPNEMPHEVGRRCRPAPHREPPRPRLCLAQGRRAARHRDDPLRVTLAPQRARSEGSGRRRSRRGAGECRGGRTDAIRSEGHRGGDRGPRGRPDQGSPGGPVMAGRVGRRRRWRRGDQARPW